LTFIKIVTRVSPPRGIASLPAGSAHIQPNMGSGRKSRAHGLTKKASGLAPSPHLTRHHSSESTTQPKSCDSLGHQ